MINCVDVWEMYRINFVTDGKTNWENFWALKDLKFIVQKGESVGIIGENGAGKSTLLKLIAGMLVPDRGKITVAGKVAGLLELGAGFQPELTGRENVYLHAGLFGLDKGAINDVYPSIESFAELGKFINAPVKYYSQGMFVRLAFAIAIHMDPDILVIDDTLAVGDEYFQRKCIRKILELKEAGKTFVLVSHDIATLRQLCKRIIFLKEGRIVCDGNFDEVAPLYSQMIGTKSGVAELKDGPMHLIFNNGRLFLNWNNIMLTPYPGAHTTFMVAGKWYNSLQASWEVSQDDERTIMARGTFYQLGLTQIWKLRTGDDNCILWDIETEGDCPVDVQEGNINMMLLKDYQRWFSSAQKGEFPLIDETCKDWEGVFENKVTRESLGVEASSGPSGQLPAIAFEQSDSFAAGQAQVLNGDYLNNCRVLQYRIPGLRGNGAVKGARTHYFSGKVLFNIPDIHGYLLRMHDGSTILSEKMKLILSSGKGMLYYENNALTKAGHIFTSLRGGNVWSSSNWCRWQVKKEGNRRILARAPVRGFPIFETWAFEFLEDESLLWKVMLEVEREVVIEEFRAQMMFSPDYSRWLCGQEQGIFPKDFSNNETDMLSMAASAKHIALQSDNGFPEVKIAFCAENGSFARIVNSDFYNKTRIIRIEKIHSQGPFSLPAGIHQIFELRVSSRR